MDTQINERFFVGFVLSTEDLRSNSFFLKKLMNDFFDNQRLPVIGSGPHHLSLCLISTFILFFYFIFPQRSQLQSDWRLGN